MLSSLLLLAFAPLFITAQTSAAQSPSTTASIATTAPPTTSTPTSIGASSTTLNGSTSSVSLEGGSNSSLPDVLLSVPQLSVGRIELVVENLQADINLNAQVASLVTINAGVSVSIQTVNITIVDVEAELELIVRLGHLVDIVQRVFESLDLNPLLITALNDVTSLVDTVVGAVDGLLGSITQGGTTLNFLIDNLGNIVQSVTSTAGTVVDSIVGNYLTNMTYTGVSETLSSGLTQKTYEYTPLNALVDIVFNSVGQIVQATVASTATSSATSTGSAAAATSTGT